MRIFAVHAVWRDARLRSMNEPSRFHVREASRACPAVLYARAMNCGGPRAFPRNQCTPVCAFLSRRSDRRPLLPSQSSLLLSANISHLVFCLIKPSHALFQTSLPPPSTTRTLHFHDSASPPAKRNHSLPAPTKQTLTNRQHGQGKQAFTLVHATALAAAVATAQAH